MNKFIVTKELGKLARWLRILGFDTVYYTSDNMGSLIIEALRGDRVIVTRRRAKIDELDKRTVVITSSELKEQLRELRTKLNLHFDESKMFSRCVLCNSILFKTDKDSVKNEVPEYVFNTHNIFMKCNCCKKIYWEGTHWGNIKNVLSSLGGES